MLAESKGTPGSGEAKASMRAKQGAGVAACTLVASWAREED
jgi:hypothetical protein